MEPPAHRPNAVIVTVLKGSAPRSGLLSIRNVRGPLAGSCHWPRVTGTQPRLLISLVPAHAGSPGTSPGTVVRALPVRREQNPGP